VFDVSPVLGAGRSWDEAVENMEWLVTALIPTKLRGRTFPTAALAREAAEGAFAGFMGYLMEGE